MSYNYKELKSFSEIIENADAVWYEYLRFKIHDEYVNTEDDKERKRISRERDKNYNERDKVRSLLTNLKRNISELQTLTDSSVLLDMFCALIDDSSKSIVHASRNLDRLYKKEDSKIRRAIRKKSADCYKIYRIVKDEWVYKDSDRPYDHFVSLEDVLKSQNYYVSDRDSFSTIMSKDYWENIDGLSILGVNVELFGKLLVISMNSIECPSEDVIEKLGKMEFIEKGKYSLLCTSTFFKVQKEYKKIEELKKKVWYTEQVLKCFADTSLKDDRIYLEASKILEKEKIKIQEKLNKIGELYNELSIDKKIELIEKLESLHFQITHMSNLIHELHLENKYERANVLSEEKSKLKFEMIKILKDNPELNQQRYNIDLKKGLKEEKDNSKIVEVGLTTNKTKKQDLTHKQEKKSVSEIKKLQSKYREMYLQEKLNNTELGEKDFSEYLSSVAPEQIQLIEYVRQQEERTRTIHAQYMKEMGDRRLKGYDVVSFEQYLKLIYKKSDYSELEMPNDIKKQLENRKTL